MEVDMELDEFECVMGRDESARVELVSNNMWKKLLVLCQDLVQNKMRGSAS